jgi:hypothetical protein
MELGGELDLFVANAEIVSTYTPPSVSIRAMGSTPGKV